jgi:hypothetical protein
MTPFIKFFITDNQFQILNQKSKLPKDSEINRYFTNLRIDEKAVFIMRQMFITMYHTVIAGHVDISLAVYRKWLSRQAEILGSFIVSVGDDERKMHAKNALTVASQLQCESGIDLDMLAQYEINYDDIPGIVPSNVYIPMVQYCNTINRAEGSKITEFSMENIRILAPVCPITSRIRIMYTQTVGDFAIMDHSESGDIYERLTGPFGFMRCVLPKLLQVSAIFRMLGNFRTDIDNGIFSLMHHCEVLSHYVAMPGNNNTITRSQNYTMKYGDIVGFAHMLRIHAAANDQYFVQYPPLKLMIDRILTVSLPPEVADLYRAISDFISGEGDTNDSAAAEKYYAAQESLVAVKRLPLDPTRTLSIEAGQVVPESNGPNDLITEISEFIESRRFVAKDLLQGAEDEVSEEDEIGLDDAEQNDDDDLLSDPAEEEGSDPLSPEEGSEDDNEDETNDDSVEGEEGDTEEDQAQSHVAKTVSDLLGVEIVLAKDATVDSVAIKGLLEFQINEVLREGVPELSPDEQQALRYFKLYWLHLVDIDTALAVIERILAGKKLPILKHINRKKV